MCKIEGCKLPSINKKHDLCQIHNYHRIHGRSMADVYNERAILRPVKRYQIKSCARPKAQTDKEKGIKSKLSDIKTQIDLDNIQDGTYYCRGCGCSYPGLDKSHVLSVGQHKHLELLKENMQLMCRSCHQRWESNDIYQMIGLHCFYENLEFMKKHSEEFYSKLKTKLDTYLKWQSKDE